MIDERHYLHVNLLQRLNASTTHSRGRVPRHPRCQGGFADSRYAVRHRHPQRPRPRRSRQSLDCRRRRDQGRTFRESGSRGGTWKNGARGARQVRVAGVDRRHGSIRLCPSTQRTCREQAARGRDDGGRWRRWNAGAGVAHTRVFRDARAAGDQHELRHVLQRDADARRSRRPLGAGADCCGAGSNARDHGHGDARRCHGHVDGADLSTVELRDDGRAGRGREGGCAVRRHLCQPHSRRGEGSRAGGGRSNRYR